MRSNHRIPIGAFGFAGKAQMAAPRRRKNHRGDRYALPPGAASHCGILFFAVRPGFTHK
jgi:hypothetical protein